MNHNQRLKQILKDVCEKTGTEVRLSPSGENETCFCAQYCGENLEMYMDGSDEETRQARGLIRYLVENSDSNRFPSKQQDALKNILLAETENWDAFRFITQFNVADAPCFALDLVPEKRIREVAAHVARCLDAGDLTVIMDDTRIAVVKFLEEGQTPFEYGQFLNQTVYEELGVKTGIGIGCEVKSFSEISASYHQAATATRMRGIFRAKGEVHTYREFLLVKMLEDVPKDKLAQYLNQYGAGDVAEVFDDAELYGAAEGFLENSLNVSEASRNLYMHRNTLLYRLDKIERATGLNVRNFSDAVTFRVISILYRLLHS